MATFDPTRLQQLREALHKAELDAWIMPIADPHLSEYVPDHWQSVEWLTGFTGSAAIVCITQNDAALFTDSRYWIQAEEELKDTPFSVVRSGAPRAISPLDFAIRSTKRHGRIGVAKTLWSIEEIRNFKRSLEERTTQPRELHIVDDLIDTVWTSHRPPKPVTPIQPLELPLVEVPSKLQRLRRALTSTKADAICLTALDEIAWLIDCRGTDILYNPVFRAHLVVTPHQARLYTETSRVNAPLVAALEEAGVTLHQPENLAQDIKRLSEDYDFLFDPKHQSPALYECIQGGTLREAQSPVLNLKRQKSHNEYKGIHQAMLSDGVALVEFYADLDQRLANSETLTELDVVELIDQQRAKCPTFRGNSFGTIVAFGPHAALPHYTPTKASNAVLTNGLLLIDSGGQYPTGTTDITRMSAIGHISEAMKKDVTIVLKGMIALASSIVPVGTSGAQLDAVARQPLWAEGLDFGHGTGHGVGYYLNVHEGPFHISPRATGYGDAGLQKGQLVSNEPGVYRVGEWGVRIENLIFSKPSLSKSPFNRFLEFEVMTLCPIDTRTLNLDLLTAEEKAWLNRYHKRVKLALNKMTLSSSARQWLAERTQPI